MSMRQNAWVSFTSVVLDLPVLAQSQDPMSVTGTLVAASDTSFAIQTDKSEEDHGSCPHRRR